MNQQALMSSQLQAEVCYAFGLRIFNPMPLAQTPEVYRAVYFSCNPIFLLLPSDSCSAEIPLFPCSTPPAASNSTASPAALVPCRSLPYGLCRQYADLCCMAVGQAAAGTLPAGCQLGLLIYLMEGFPICLCDGFSTCIMELLIISRPVSESPLFILLHVCSVKYFIFSETILFSEQH